MILSCHSSTVSLLLLFRDNYTDSKRFPSDKLKFFDYFHFLGDHPADFKHIMDKIFFREKKSVPGYGYIDRYIVNNSITSLQVSTANL